MICLLCEICITLKARTSRSSLPTGLRSNSTPRSGTGRNSAKANGLRMNNADDAILLMTTILTLLRLSLVFEIDSVKILLGAEPCFLQVDLLVRALLSDPEVGYVPHLIIFQSKCTTVKARTLFMDPTFRPPRALMDTYPTSCDAAECKNTDCALFCPSVCRSLVNGTRLIRTENIARTAVRCNFWPCDNEEPEGSMTFSKCQKCKEVLNCSNACQVSRLKISSETHFTYQCVRDYAKLELMHCMHQCFR